jgi:hypothetical protein
MPIARKLVAVLIALRAFTNFVKPFRPGAAFVILGRLQTGVAATVVAPLFGVAMLVYAALLFRGHPAARPLAVVYALWATVNVVLFPVLEGVPLRFAPWMYVLFAVPGVVVPWLAVWLVGPGPSAGARPRDVRHEVDGGRRNGAP